MKTLFTAVVETFEIIRGNLQLLKIKINKTFAKGEINMVHDYLLFKFPVEESRVTNSFTASGLLLLGESYRIL